MAAAECLGRWQEAEMVSPLLGSIARTIANAASFMMLDATLVRDVPIVGGDPADPTPPVTHQTFTCKAMEDTYSSYDRANGLAGEKDVRVLILAKTLAVEPQPLDRITIRGRTMTIVPSPGSITGDPAQATWTCRCMT